MPSGSNPEPSAGGVSKRMLVVVIALLLVILVPTASLCMPTCRVVIKLTNTDAEYTADCWFYLDWLDYGISEHVLGPGEEVVVTDFVRPGSYDVHLQYWILDGNHTWSSFDEGISLSVFETVRVEFEVERWW